MKYTKTTAPYFLFLRILCNQKKENPSSARSWDEAVQELRKGDHYLLVFLDVAPILYASNQGLFGWSFWKLLGIGILILVIGIIVFAAMLHHGESGPAR